MRIIEDTKYRCSNCGAIFPLHLEQCKECGRDAKTVDYSYLKAQEAEKEAKAIEEAKAAAEKAEVEKAEAKAEVEKAKAEKAEAERLAAEKVAAEKVVEYSYLKAQEAEKKKAEKEAKAIAEAKAIEEAKFKAIEEAKAAAEKAEVERLAADKAEVEKAEAERLAAEKAAAEKFKRKNNEPSKKNKLVKAPTKKVDYSYLKTSFKSKEPSKKKKPDIEKNIHCPECRVEQKNKDAIYCFKCGKDIYPKEFINIKKCPKCDKQYDDSYNFCENDGATLENKTVEVGDDSTMPMKWYKFVTYFQIPLISIIYLILTFISKDVILLSGTIIGTIQIYGFHYKTKWSWKLHIFFIVFYSILESIIRFGITGNPIILIVGPILINAIVTYPIYIYFNKRKHLFVN